MFLEKTTDLHDAFECLKVYCTIFANGLAALIIHEMSAPGKTPSHPSASFCLASSSVGVINIATYQRRLSPLPHTQWWLDQLGFTLFLALQPARTFDVAATISGWVRSCFGVTPREMERSEGPKKWILRWDVFNISWKHIKVPSLRHSGPYFDWAAEEVFLCSENVQIVQSDLFHLTDKDPVQSWHI